MIISEKIKEKKKLFEKITDTTTLAKMPQVSSFVNLARRYIWAISNADLDLDKKLGLTGIKKYWKYIKQVKLELNCLHDWISAMAIFVKYSH